jgi:hypothetical protein
MLEQPDPNHGNEGQHDDLAHDLLLPPESQRVCAVPALLSSSDRY